MAFDASLPRRGFLAAAAAAPAFAQDPNRLSLPKKSPPPLPAAPMPFALAGKDPRLTMLSPAPLVLETPDALLAAARITPVSALFVRQHHGAGPFNDMRPRPLAGWSLEVVGLARSGRSAEAGFLAGLPPVEVEMVLQCSGNFRKRFAAIAPIKGTPWSAGGIGNVVFAGVRLRDAFKALGVEPAATARFLTVEGRDQPELPTQNDFEHSVPLEEALEHGLLATHLNGQPLPALHGGPLRFVLPGYYGTMHVKWVHRFRLEAGESASHYQAKDYRVPLGLVAPGSPAAFTETNSRPNYGMKVNCRIFAPVAGGPCGRAARIVGVAWNDGRAALETVHVSADRGQTWQRAALAAPTSPYAWRPWTAVVALSPGPQEVWARATDALGRTQPLDGAPLWNPGGYEWNAVDRVAFTVA